MNNTTVQVNNDSFRSIPFAIYDNAMNLIGGATYHTYQDSDNNIIVRDAGGNMYINGELQKVFRED